MDGMARELEIKDEVSEEQLRKWLSGFARALIQESEAEEKSETADGA